MASAGVVLGSLSLGGRGSTTILLQGARNKISLEMDTNLV